MIVEEIITGASNNAAIFKNCSSFINFATEINKSRVDEASKVNLIIPMYNLTQHSENSFETFLGLWQYHRDETNFDNDISVAATTANSESLKFKNKKKGLTKNIEITVPLKYSSNCWRDLEFFLVNCEINVKTTCSGKFWKSYKRTILSN